MKSEPEINLRGRVERITGSKPVSWKAVHGGYTMAERWLMQLQNGESVFVKASTDEETAGWLRDEQRVYATISADFLPKYIGSDEKDLPILILEDLSAATWSWHWNAEYIQRVQDALNELAAINMPNEFPSLSEMSTVLMGWQEISKDPAGFLSLGLVTEEWLREALPILIDAERRVNLGGDSLVHVDVRSDNICFKGNQTKFVDWNWARRGNPKLDLISWLPTLHIEGGPPPWDFTLDEPELIAAVAGFYAKHAYQPPQSDAQGPARRKLQLNILKSALPWAIKALNLQEV